MALLILLTPLYIRFLGIEGYGFIGFYLSWIAILGILDTGVAGTAMREIAWLEARPEERINIPTLLRSMEVVYWGVILVLGIGILAGAWFFGADWFQAKTISSKMARETLMLMAVSLVVQVPSGLYVAGLMGLQKQVECSGLLALLGTLRGLGAVLVLWLIAPDIRLFFVWQIVISVLQTGVMRYSLWRKVSVKGQTARFSPDMLRSIKGYAGGMTLITALSILMTQADKMILSKMVSLEALGFYMLAWTVASGLSRVAVPLVQAFSPRFTDLVSRGYDEALARQLRLASQLMNVLILPLAVLVAFFSNSILFVWTGDKFVAEGAAPILTIMLIGTVFSVCSFPSLMILHSKKQLKPVIWVNLTSLVILMPLLVVVVIESGVLGGAFIWALYGLILYIAYQKYGLREIHEARLFHSILRDFMGPFIVSLVVAGIASGLLSEVSGKLTFVIELGVALVVGWLAALLVCKDLLEVILRKLKWTMKTNR